jgi:hypothetical protein
MMNRKEWALILQAVKREGTRRNWAKVVCRLSEQCTSQPPKRVRLGRRLGREELARRRGMIMFLIGMVDRGELRETFDRDRIDQHPWPCERAPERTRPGNGGRRPRRSGSDMPAWPRREPR